MTGNEYQKLAMRTNDGKCTDRLCGCTVSIVKDDAVDAFIEKVGTAYKNKIGYAADFYVVEIGDGPVKLA